MYKKIKIKELIRVSPVRQHGDLKKSIIESLREKFEGRTTPATGVMLSVIDIETIGDGVIYPTDAGIHYPVIFNMLVFKPELHEVVEGDVIEVAEFGAFIRMGPMDGLVHVSQIMDDFVNFDDKSAVFLGKKSRRTIKEGDHVRARIISISYEKESKVGLTMRQPGLGVMEWIENEKKGITAAPIEEKATAKTAPKKDKKPRQTR